MVLFKYFEVFKETNKLNQSTYSRNLGFQNP